MSQSVPFVRACIRIVKDYIIFGIILLSEVIAYNSLASMFSFMGPCVLIILYLLTLIKETNNFKETKIYYFYLNVTNSKLKSHKPSFAARVNFAR